MKVIFENGMHAIVSEPNTVIDYGNGYCHKLYRKTNDFTDCIEIDIPNVEEEPSESDYAEVGKILMGVSE